MRHPLPFLPLAPSSLFSFSCASFADPAGDEEPVEPTVEEAWTPQQWLQFVEGHPHAAGLELITVQFRDPDRLDYRLLDGAFGEQFGPRWSEHLSWIRLSERHDASPLQKTRIASAASATDDSEARWIAEAIGEWFPGNATSQSRLVTGSGS